MDFILLNASFSALCSLSVWEKEKQTQIIWVRGGREEGGGRRGKLK